MLLSIESGNSLILYVLIKACYFLKRTIGFIGIYTNRLANGTKAENLTIKEYQQITKMHRFPKLPLEASNINYSYEYDGFLPDYLFTMTYDLPAEMTIDEINYRKGDFTKYQSFVTIGNIKRVTYSEGEQ